MYRLTSKLIIYRKIPRDSILFRLSEICQKFSEGDYGKEELTGEILDQINRLLDLSTTYGFDRNLWHNYLAYLLATTETPFTLVSEKVGANEGSVNHFAENDFAVFVLVNFTHNAAVEAAPTTVFHAGVKACALGIAAETFPVACVAVKVRDIVPRKFRRFETEHAAEAPVSAEKAAMFIDFEIC